MRYILICFIIFCSSNKGFSQCILKLDSFNKREHNIQELLKVKINNSSEIKFRQYSKQRSISKVDSLYFKDNRLKRWNQALCKIPEKDTISFFYNDCCSGFLVFNNGKRIRNLGKVTFINNTNTIKVGSLGWSSVVIPPNDTITLIDTNNSPMHSDIVPIKVDRVDFLVNGSGKSLEELYYNIRKQNDKKYKNCKTKTFAEFRWVFLSTQEVVVLIDSKYAKIQKVIAH